MRKEKRREIYLLYILFAIYLIISHFFIMSGSNDDAWFAEVLDNYELIDYLSMRYIKWTSRLPIETLIIFLSRMNPWIWKLMNIMIILLLVFECNLIFGKSGDVLYTGMFILLIVLIPYGMLSSAGWIATTINYLWPITIGILTLIPLRKWETGEKIRKWEYLIYFAACLFSCFQEQVAAVLFVVYILYAGYRLYHKKKIPPFLYVLFAAALVLLLFIFTCPGNENRSILETEKWFPEFANISFVQKILIGYLNTFSYYISCGEFNTIFVLFSYVLFLAVFILKKNLLLRGIALYPFIVSLCWGYGGRTIMSWNITTRIYWMGLIQNENLSEYGVYKPEHIFVECLIFLTVLCAVLISLFVVFGKSTEFCVAFTTLSAGLCSRLVLGFSPTVYTSGARTATLGYICFIILIFLCIQKGISLIHTKKYIVYYTPCYLFSLIATIMTRFQ